MDGAAQGPGPADGVAPRRRYLTILFSDLSDSTRIAAGIEAEDYAELLDRLRAIFTAIVDRHGGTIVRIDGDGFAVLFGYPAATEDDSRRAVEAALDLHEAVAALPYAGGRLQLHSGVHSGLVLVNPGDVMRGRFEMLGDATNVAARLADAAKSGEILVSEATLGTDRHFFVTGPRRRLMLKGKEQPVAVFDIEARAGVGTRFAARKLRGFAPFVGRATELERLDECLSAALKRQNRLAVLAGAAGVGKTRLGERFLADATAAGCLVHRSYCEVYLGAEPLQPFLQLLRSVFGLAPGTPAAVAAAAVTKALGDFDLKRHAPTLLQVLSLSSDICNRPGAADVAESICALFAVLAESAPLVLFIDDWQAADDASRQVLAAVQRMPAAGILVLIATRGLDSSGFAGATVLPLTPFEDAEATAAIVAQLPAADPFQVARIREYSGGNALFIEELCHSLAHGNAEGRPDGGSAWLDALVQYRFTRLSEADAALAQAAAVIGTEVPVWLLEAMIGGTDFGDRLAGLADADFLYPAHRQGMLRFKHGITRDVVYSTVGLRQRRLLHLDIARVMRGAGADDEWCEALAYHFAAGGDHASAAHYAERAGDKAMAVSALDRAQGQYRAALDAIDASGESAVASLEWSRIFRRYVRASLFDPSREQVPVYERALAQARASGDPSAIAWADYWLGCCYHPLGETRASIRHCERALAAAGVLGDEGLRVQATASLGQSLVSAGYHQRAMPLLEAAIAEKRGPGRLSINLAYSVMCRGFALADQGQFEASDACYDEAHDAVRGAFPEVEVSLLGQRGIVRLWQGRAPEALAFITESEALAARVRARYGFAMARAVASYARWTIDGDSGAARDLTEATSWLAAERRHQHTSLNHGWLAEILTSAQEWGAARHHAAQALRRARQGDPFGSATAWRVLAQAAAAGHAIRASGDYLDRALAAAAARNSPHEAIATQLCAAALALAAGRRPEALAQLDRAEPVIAALAMVSHRRAAARLREACRSA